MPTSTSSPEVLQNLMNQEAQTNQATNPRLTSLYRNFCNNWGLTIKLTALGFMLGSCFTGFIFFENYLNSRPGYEEDTNNHKFYILAGILPVSFGSFGTVIGCTLTSKRAREQENLNSSSFISPSTQFDEIQTDELRIVSSNISLTSDVDSPPCYSSVVSEHDWTEPPSYDQINSLNSY